MTVSSEIYQDIALRTNGEIYIGVVGPVRTGKSTFIKNFMEALVLPAISDQTLLSRTRDQLPQSGSGRTITTSEPKFIPEEAQEITVSGVTLKVRLADCVGFMVKGALGGEENGEERMVATPWFTDEVALTKAAEEGTRRVMTEHATVGIVITTDGSVTDLGRESYPEAEGKIIREMQETGKPFIILVNSKAPSSSRAQETAKSIEETYGLPALPVDILHMGEGEIQDILRSLLFEFPVGDLMLDLPDYMTSLPCSHPAKAGLISLFAESTEDMEKIRDLERLPALLSASELLESASILEINLGLGCVRLAAAPPRSLFFDLINAMLPEEYRVSGDDDLPRILKELSDFHASFSRYASAVEEALENGYSMLPPVQEELVLEDPEIVRKGGRFGVKLSASAPTLHMMKVQISSTVCPIVGSEKQSEELMDNLLGEYEGEEEKLWSSNIFGKSLQELINEGLAQKLDHITDETGQKFRDTLERAINEGSGGMICIIL